MGDRILRVRKWIVIDALVLLALSAYEFISRVDAMWGPLKMFVSMAVGEGIPLKRAAAYVYMDMGIFEVPGFMLLCIVLSLVSILSIRTRRGSYVLLPVSLLLTVWGLFVQMSLLGELIRFVKVLPLLLLSILHVVNIFLQRAQHRALRERAQHRALRERAQRIGHYAGYSPVPPQRMEGRRFQHGIVDHPARLPRRKRVS